MFLSIFLKLIGSGKIKNRAEKGQALFPSPFFANWGEMSSPRTHPEGAFSVRPGLLQNPPRRYPGDLAPKALYLNPPQGYLFAPTRITTKPTLRVPRRFDPQGTLTTHPTGYPVGWVRWVVKVPWGSNRRGALRVGFVVLLVGAKRYP